MTSRQEELLLAIDCQKQIVASVPGDVVEEAVLDSLYVALRDTFHVVRSSPTPQYVYSPSRAVLKRVH